MKIELEIDDLTLSRMRVERDTVCLLPFGEDPPPPSVERVTRYVTWLVMRYTEGPEIVQPYHKMALAVVRARAVDQAVTFAKPGEDQWEFKRRVDGIVDAMIERDS